MNKGKEAFNFDQKSKKSDYTLKSLHSNHLVPLITHTNTFNKNSNQLLSKNPRSPVVKWNNFCKETNIKTVSNIHNSIESVLCHKKNIKSEDIWSGYYKHFHNGPSLPAINSNNCNNQSEKDRILFKVSGELNTTYNYDIINQPNCNSDNSNSDRNDRETNTKFHTLIFRKINKKKYTNVINSNTINSIQNKPPSYEIDIDESIPSNSNNDLSSIKHSKTNPNSINSSSSDSRFKTRTNLLEMDKYLHKTIKGKEITWTAGEIISEGKNSVVYKALNEDEGIIFVVKRFNCPKDKCDGFLNEVKVYEQLRHENIIKYYSSEEINSQLFIYLEYMPSGSLRNIVDHYGKLNESLIKHYSKQIIAGLKYLHLKGIVHRDIKCANILIDSKGCVKLCDFGCSKQIAMSVSDSSSNEEFCTSLKGTIPWCAPEVICQKKYGKKADIWSLGCSLIEMGGCQPWGKMDNLYQVMTKIGKSTDLPIVPQYFSDILKDFISLCLVRDPKHRAKLKQLIKHPFLH